MPLLSRLRALLKNLTRRSKVDRDLKDELESYLALVDDEARASGADDATARRAARLQLGGIEQVKESVRQGRAGAGLERLSQDVRYAVRGLRRAPGFAAIAIALLTLGIGANTALFSVADAALFKPLPYTNPEQLVQIVRIERRGTAEWSGSFGLSWTELDRWRAQTQIFAGTEPFASARPMRIEGDTSVGPTWIGRVSPGFIEMLGLDPILGRRFAAGDARPDPGVLLLTEGYWRRAFNADRTVLGRALTMDGRPYTIVGVMPDDFGYPFSPGGRSTAAWLPLDEASASIDGRAGRGARSVGVIHRLRAGLTAATAERILDAAAESMQTGAAAKWEVDLYPIDSRSQSLGTTRIALFVLLGAVACVLLIACANIANLLLSRVFARQREVAVRAALGATRGRLIRQFLTEGLVLSMLGGVGATALAWWLVRLAPTVAPGSLGLFRSTTATLDARALAVCGGAVLLTALLSSLLPAFQASRTNIVESLVGGRSAGAAPGARRLRLTLQTIEVAFTLILLTGAGLLTRSLIGLLRTEPGFAIDGMVSTGVSLPKDRYPTKNTQQEFFDTLISRVRSLPQIRSATYGLPPTGAAWGNFTPFADKDPAPRGGLTVAHVDADYFSATGIPVLQGRPFNADDRPNAPPIAIVDARAADLAWPGQSAIGQRFRYSPLVPWITVVGVVGHVKTKDFSQGTFQAYLPRSQDTEFSFGMLTVRSDGEPTGAVASIGKIVHQMDSALTLSPPMIAAEAYAGDLAMPQFYLVLMGGLATLALITAMVGLYGVLSYSVAQRAREIGVRVALGATHGSIKALVLREALGPVLAGAAAGFIGAWWLSTFLTKSLYQVSARDPLTFTLVVALLMAVAFVATWVPVRRAVRVDPMITLRLE